MKVEDNSLSIRATKPMRSDRIAVFRLDIECLRCKGIALAMLNIARSCTSVHVPRLRYGNATKHTADGGIEYVIVIGGTANRPERIGEGLGRSCEHCTRC